MRLSRSNKARDEAHENDEYSVVDFILKNINHFKDKSRWSKIQKTAYEWESCDKTEYYDDGFSDGRKDVIRHIDEIIKNNHNIGLDDILTKLKQS
jgi:hypothetical protein